MAASITPPGITSAYERETARIVAARVPFALFGMVVCFSVAGLLEYQAHPERISSFVALFAIEIAGLLVAIILPRRRTISPRAHLDLVTLAVANVHVLMNLYHIINGGEMDLLGRTLALTNVTSMLLFPWGAGRQMVVCVTGLVLYGIALQTADVVSTAPGIGFILQTGIATITILSSRINDRLGRRYWQQTSELRKANGALRQANQALHRQMAEVQIAGSENAALARAGQDLIGSISGLVVLDRLCYLATEALRCDRSDIFLLREDLGAYVWSAGQGGDAAETEALRSLSLPVDVVDPPLAALDPDHVIFTDNSPFRLPGDAPGLSLAIGLRRRDRLIGVQTAIWKLPTAAVRRYRGLAARIGQLGSLAWENSRLLDELARANRLKSDFLATVSHEFRTPLNVIIGYDDLLLDEDFGALNEEQREVIERVKVNSRQLLDLISTILDVSRLEGGRSPLVVAPVPVAELLAAVEARNADQLLSRPRLALRIHTAPDLPALHTDAAKLELVLHNLVSNAIKFTPAGEVTITADNFQGGIRFRIRDTGIGIDPDQLSTVFEPFRQLGATDALRRDGVGLGLYIVRRLLELLRGTISVQSTVGTGSEFTVWIPH